MKKLIQFELRKIFSNRLTQIALITLFLLSALLCFSTYQNMYACDGINEGTGRKAVEIDKSVAEKYEGILTNEKVHQMMSDFALKFDLHGMNAAYLYQNATQSAVFARFSDINGNWNGLRVSDVFGNEEIKIGYTYGWLETSQNMAKVFIFLSFIVIIMTAPVFSGEYSGVDNIILTSKYGRTKCGTAKIIAGFTAAVSVTALTSFLNFVPAIILYGTSGLDCSILFAPIGFTEAYIPFNITCGLLLKYQILLAFTGAVSITGITLLFSSICKNQITALAVSAAIYFFPILLPVSETNPLFRYIALLPLYHVQFISLMSIEQLSNGLLYAALAVPFALVLMLSCSIAARRFFAKHQVL